MAAPVIVIIGPPGAGKGTQSDILAKRLGAVHLSSGQILREQADAALAATMAKGELVDLETFERIVGPSIAAIPMDKGLILDGFIRTSDDAQWLAEFLAHGGRKISRFLYLELDETASDKRNLARHRSDDKSAVLATRWEEFRTETMPVIQDFKRSGQLTRIDASGSIEEVTKIIEQATSD